MSDAANIILGVIGAGIGFFVGGPAGAAAGFAIGYGTGAGLEALIHSMIQLPEAPASSKQGSQVYNLSARQNLARIGQPIPVIYGEPFTYPDLLTQPFVRHIDNEQYLHQIMVVTAGEADLLQLYIGETPIESFADVEVHLYAPGATVDCWHNNVYTNEEVQDLTLVTVGVSVTAAMTFSATAHTAAAPAGTFTDKVKVGNYIAISSTASNNQNGVPVADVSSDGSTLVLTATLVDESAAAATLTVVSDLVGPFYANPAGTNISQFEVDIVYPGGLFYVLDDGNLSTADAYHIVRWRQAGATSWITADSNLHHSAADRTPQRKTETYTLPSWATGRIEVQVVRKSTTSTSTRQTDESHWAGLRGYIQNPTYVMAGADKPVWGSDGVAQYPLFTVLAVKMRATNQLSAAMTKQIRGHWARKLRRWTGSAWTAPERTTSIAWAFADVVTNTVYGIGMPDSALPLAELLAQDTTWAARGDRFSVVVDTDMTAWDALSKIARCGRATPQYDGRQYWMVRDEPQTVRAAMLADPNGRKGTLAMEFDLPGDETPPGVVVSYTDPDTGQLKSIACPQDADPAKCTKLDLWGCDNRDQAWREGMFVYWETLYRRVQVKRSLERDAWAPGFGSLVAVQSAAAQWGTGATLLRVDGSTLTLDQSPDWSAGSAWQALIWTPEGEDAPVAVSCTRGSSDRQIVLDALPEVALVPFGTATRATIVALGNETRSWLDAIVLSREAEDEHRATLTCVLDDPRVHADPGPAYPEDQAGASSGTLAGVLAPASINRTIHGAALSFSVTASVTGAAGTPSYTWSMDDGSAVYISATDGATVTCSVSLAPGESAPDTLRCIATDGVSTLVLTAPVLVARYATDTDTGSL